MLNFFLSHPVATVNNAFDPVASDVLVAERRTLTPSTIEQFLLDRGLELAQAPVSVEHDPSLLANLVFAPKLREGHSAVAAQASIRVEGILLNTFGLPSLFGQGGSRFSRLAEIGDSLAVSGVDFVALQECWHKSIKTLIDRSAFPFVAQGGLRLDGLINNRGLIILSKHPIEAQDEIRFTQQVGLERFVGKGAQWVRLDLGDGKQLDLFNTHLASGRCGVPADRLVPLGQAEKVRESQLIEFFQFVAAKMDTHIPAILLGDFNFTVKSSEYETARSILGPDLSRMISASRSGEDPLKLVPEVTLSPTNPLQRDRAQKPINVDYAFGVGARLGAPESSSMRMFVERPLSDHYGRRFDLVLHPDAALGETQRAEMLSFVAAPIQVEGSDSDLTPHSAELPLKLGLGALIGTLVLRRGRHRLGRAISRLIGRATA